MVLSIENSLLIVKVVPNAAKTEIREITNGTAKIAVAAPPDKNKANKELLKFLKKSYNIKARIKSGQSSHEKVLELI